MAETKTYHLKKIPPDITKILNREKAKILSSRGITQSKEFIMYQIIRAWDAKSEVKSEAKVPVSSAGYKNREVSDDIKED